MHVMVYSVNINFAFVYLNDIVVLTRTSGNHDMHFWLVLMMLPGTGWHPDWRTIYVSGLLSITKTNKLTQTNRRPLLTITETTESMSAFTDTRPRKYDSLYFRRWFKNIHVKLCQVSGASSKVAKYGWIHQFQSLFRQSVSDLVYTKRADHVRVGPLLYKKMETLVELKHYRWESQMYVAITTVEGYGNLMGRWSRPLAINELNSCTAQCACCTAEWSPHWS